MLRKKLEGGQQGQGRVRAQVSECFSRSEPVLRRGRERGPVLCAAASGSEFRVQEEGEKLESSLIN